MKRARLRSWRFLLILAAVVLCLTGRNSAIAPQTEDILSTQRVNFTSWDGATEAAIQTLTNANASAATGAEVAYRVLPSYQPPTVIRCST
jgi:spermidine/putrescine-binding protein